MSKSGAKATRVCTVCGKERKIAWGRQDRPDYQPDTYVCKYCKPPKNGPRYVTFDMQDYQRRWNWLKRYGITPEQYDEILEEQGGVCKICKNLPGKYRLHVDHDHETGKVRGLLCVTCNSRLEWTVEHMDKILEYLKEA